MSLDIAPVLIGILAAIPAVISIMIESKRKRMAADLAFEEHRQREREFHQLWMDTVVRGCHSDGVIQDEGGYFAPPGTEEALATIANGTLASMAREVPRGALPEPNFWEVIVRDGIQQTRMSFGRREEFEAFIQSIPRGVVSHAEFTAVRSPDIWTFGSPYPENISRQIVASFEIITDRDEAVMRGGILLHTDDCARRFGPAFGPEVRIPDTTDEEFERLSRMRAEMLSREELRHGLMGTEQHALPEIREMREARARQLAAGHEAGLISRDELRRELLGIDIDAFEGRLPMSQDQIRGELNEFEGGLPITSGSGFESAINMTASSCFSFVERAGRSYRLSPEEEAEMRRQRDLWVESMNRGAQPTPHRVFPPKGQGLETAVKKAKDLLKAVLTEAEIQELEEFSTVTIKTKVGLFRIRIDKQISTMAPTYNVTHKRHRWCLNLSQMVESVEDLPLQDYPTPDHYAAQVLLLRTDPERFMRVANKRQIDPMEDE